MLRLNRGFTLIELMVTLAVMAIVIAWAAPSFKQQMLSSRTGAAAHELADALNYARSQSVRTLKRVSICASSNGTSCTGNWSDGFIVFEDRATSDKATSIDMGSTPLIYRAWPKLESPGTFSVKRGSTDVSFIRFTPLGALAPTSSDPVAVSLKLTGCSGKSAKAVSVNLSGLVSVANADC
jgi:type IV fimbrial biogenesis protein FimT